jgi:hypothetical protein
MVNLIFLLFLLVALVTPLAGISAFFQEHGFHARMRLWFLLVIVEIMAIIMTVIFGGWYAKISFSGQPKSRTKPGRD